MFKVPEEKRVKEGKMGTTEKDGNNGVFHIHFGPMAFAYCIASDGGYEDNEWEHVSVTVHNRGKIVMPTWEQMCKIKDMFWGEDDTVVQYHPAKKDYVNRHPKCLHLWKPVGKEFLKPPKEFVG